jgi:hypothetical protein
MHIEVPVEKLELSADIANHRIKIGCADRQFAAVQDSIQNQCAYRWHIVLLLIPYGTCQLEFAGRDRSIPKDKPGVLRVNRNPVRPAGGRLRIVAYLALQFERGGSHREKQRFEPEFGRSCVEAGSQVVEKGFHISVENASVSVGKVTLVTFSNELRLDFDL